MRQSDGGVTPAPLVCVICTQCDPNSLGLGSPRNSGVTHGVIQYLVCVECAGWGWGIIFKTLVRKRNLNFTLCYRKTLEGFKQEKDMMMFKLQEEYIRV